MISQQSLDVSKKIYRASNDGALDELMSPEGYTKPPIEPVKLDVWLKTCNEYLQKENLISEESKSYIIDRIVSNAKLKQHFPPGKKLCITVIPFSHYGYPLEQEDIDEENYIRILFIDERNMLEPGFYERKNTVFRNLPVEIRKELTFTAGPYENKEPYNITDGDRQKIRAELERIFKSAMEIYNKQKI